MSKTQVGVKVHNNLLRYIDSDVTMLRLKHGLRISRSKMIEGIVNKYYKDREAQYATRVLLDSLEPDEDAD